MSSSAEQIPATNATALTAIIAENVATKGGWIGFDAFMQQALYHPEYGYYSASSEKIGEHGDFITAPELGSLFATCLARQCAQVLAIEGCHHIYEFGAGKGTLAADILQALDREDSLPEHYYIIELSADLAARQRQIITALPDHLSQRVQWLSTLPDTFNGCIIANELLDAMPCIRFEVDAQGQPRALGVGVESGVFHWQTGDVLAPSTTEQRPIPQIPGYQSEICLQAEGWVTTVGERLEKGMMLLIDYGFPEQEFYHPDRTGGTLMCHFEHRAHPDPFFLPGNQDITTHIDFSAIARAGVAAGLHPAGYTDQANFLISCGLLDIISSDQNNLTDQEMLERSAEVKKLIMPHEMGELFKVIAFSRQIDESLVGFKDKNQISRLLP